MFSLDLATIVNSAIAAAESSVSVILVLFYGYICSKTEFLSETGERVCIFHLMPRPFTNWIIHQSISKLCVNLFLPAMLLTDMGSHISLKTLKEFWPLVALPIIVLFITYILGRLSVRFLNQPNYVVPGMVFNNVVAMPLLLMEAISNSDVLLPLLRENESIEQALVRARAYVLLHGIVHNLARFALGPLMLKGGTPSSKADVESTAATQPILHNEQTEHSRLLGSNGSGSMDYDTVANFRKRARLLSTGSIDADEAEAILGGLRIETDSTGHSKLKRRNTFSGFFNRHSSESAEPLLSPDDPLAIPPEPTITRSNSLFFRILETVEQFLNPAVIAALLAIVIGVIPFLHYFFYNNVAIESSFTQSIRSIGGLYPALQLFALGSKLTAPLRQPVRKSTIILIAIVRFAISGIISVSIVAFMSSHASPSVWPMDPMLNFVLMITPVGPPAITLAAVAEIAGVSPEEVTAVSRMLLYTYTIAPLVAPTVAVALSIAYQIKPWKSLGNIEWVSLIPQDFFPRIGKFQIVMIMRNKYMFECDMFLKKKIFFFML